MRSPHPHPNNHHIINDTKKHRRHVCTHVHTPATGVETQPPIPHDTTLTTLWKLLLLFFILPIRRDRPQHSRPGGKANRESCIDHAAAGQIERHVETNVTKRSQERKGRARDKTRGRPSLGWVSFCCPSGQRLYRAFQERRILSGNGKTFRHNLLGRDRRRDERQLHRDASPGQGTYFDIRALFMPHGSAWVSGKRRDGGMNVLCLVDLLGKKNMARDFEDRRC